MKGARQHEARVRAGAPLVLGAVLCLTAPTLAGAQQRGQMIEPALVRQAEDAFAGGDRERARQLYSNIVQRDPGNSRAVYRLAQLQPPGSSQALAGFREYVRLEPRDPWGYAALADASAAAGDVAAAGRHYRQGISLAPGDAEMYLGLGRLLKTLGHKDEWVRVCESWVSAQPRDATAWLELGRARQQAQRHVEAADAYAQALSLSDDQNTRQRLDNALAESAMSLRPQFGLSTDTDGNDATRWGAEALWQLTARARWGARFGRADVTDAAETGSVDELALRTIWQPLAAVRVDGTAGVARLRTDTSGGAEHYPLLRLRTRAGRPTDGVSGDVRATRAPLIATPALLSQPVELSELNGGLEVPLRGLLRARLRGQAAQLDAAAESNQRSGFQAGPVLRWRSGTELNASYSELQYEEAPSAPYFAPRRVQAMELGTYFERYDWWPIVLALDAGVGVQRVTEHGARPEDWRGTFRAWGLVSWEMRPGVRLELEIDHGNLQLVPDAAALNSRWSSTSALLSLQFGLLPRSSDEFIQRRNARAANLR